MALGNKLGKIFGAVGSGLSFIPGPWSIVGAVLGQAGGIASQVGEAKDRKKAEMGQPSVTQNQPAAQDGGERAPQAQLGMGEQQPQTPQPGLFQPNRSQYNLGNVSQQLDSSVAQMLLRDSGGLYE